MVDQFFATYGFLKHFDTKMVYLSICLYIYIYIYLYIHLKKCSGKWKFQGKISQLVSMHLIWNFDGSLVEHQSCYKQNFKFLAVQEPNFLEPKFRQNWPLTGFCMYIGPASVFFLYLDLSSVLCRGCFSDVFGLPYRLASLLIYIYIYLPKTKKFGCVGRGDLTSLFFSKVVKY